MLLRPNCSLVACTRGQFLRLKVQTPEGSSVSHHIISGHAQTEACAPLGQQPTDLTRDS